MFTPLLGENNSELGNIILGYIGVPVTISQTLTLSEVITDTPVHNQSLSQSLTLSETITNVTVHNRSLSESLTLAETLTSKKIFVRTTNQSLTLAETLTNDVIFARAIHDTLHLNESIHQHPFHITIAIQQRIDAGLQERILLTNHPINSDSLSFTQIISQTVSAGRTTSQTLTFFETVNVSGNAFTFVRYDAILGDIYTRLGYVILGHVPYVPKILGETLAVTDAINPPIKILENISITEGLSTLRDHPELIDDTLTFVQNVNILGSVGLFIDTLVFEESTSGITGTYYPENVNQVLSFGETVRIDLAGDRAVFDVLTLVETITFGHDVFHRSFVDTLTFVESLGKHREVNQYFLDTLTLAETLTYTREVIRRIKDKLNIVETVHRNIIANRTIQDKLTFLDPIPLKINFNTTVYINDVQYVIIHQQTNNDNNQNNNDNQNSHPPPCCVV